MNISYFFILLLALIAFSCNSMKPASNSNISTTMNATIIRELFYENIPSASGLEVVGNNIYIVGDDSPYLYQLDNNFKLIDKIALTDTAGFESGRVAKDKKMDLESMASFSANGKTHLLIFGSGSTEARMKAIVAEVDVATGKVSNMNTYPLERLYKKLQQDERVVGSAILNIEGAAVESGKLYLMHRGVNKEPNVLLVYDLENFIVFLAEEGEVPTERVIPLKLKELNGFEAGLSGAHIFDGKLFFTASVEGTTDAIADGEVFGSYVGFIDLDSLEKNNGQSVSPASALLTHKNGSIYKGKAESLIVSKGKKSGSYSVLVVSDDDQGHSELLKVEIAL